MSSPKVAIAHLGARKHYQEPILFHEWGVLERFYTDFYAGHGRITKFLRSPAVFPKLPGALKKGLDRYDPILEQAPVTHFPTFGYQYIQKLKNSSPQQACSIYNWAGKEFCRRIIRHGLGDANTLYGFPVSSLELFEYAKSEGLRCILDQIIAERAFTYELLEEEETLWADWSNTPFQLQAAERELIAREQQEQRLADHIVCGSEFVKASLIAKGIKDDRISVVSLGRLKDEIVPTRRSTRSAPKARGEELRILFAGAVNLRKGIPYLLVALRALKGKIPFTCKAAGSIEIKPERVAEYSDVCEFLGRVPRSQMSELYDWADVFVLPSIVEGSAMVTYEALMCGLPIITTHNAGSLVRHELDGYIVKVRNAEAIAEQLGQLYEVGIVAQQSERQNYVLEVFDKAQETLRSVVCESLN